MSPKSTRKSSSTGAKPGTAPEDDPEKTVRRQNSAQGTKNSKGTKSSKGTKPPKQKGQEPQKTPTPQKRKRKPNKNKLVRQLHAWISMASLATILFFGLTGLSLNHPEWGFGRGEQEISESGELPNSLIDGANTDLLGVSTYFRDEFNVRGEIKDFDRDSNPATITYRNAGYSADASINTETGEFSLDIVKSGWLSTLTDLHRGHDTGAAWGWVIDIAAVSLVVIATTGILLTAWMKNRERPRGFMLATIGLIVFAGAAALVLS